MSETFSSHLGNLWAKRNAHRVTSNFNHCLLRTLADCFNHNGYAWPSVTSLIADMGGKHSRGQVLRGLNALEAAGLIRITDRGGGGKKTMSFQALGWTDGAAPPNREQTTHPETTHRAGDSPRDDSGCSAGDSEGPVFRGAGDSPSSPYQDKDSRQGKDKVVARTRAPATASPPPPPDLLGDVPAQPRTAPTHKPAPHPTMTAETMLVAWNQAVAGTKIPKAQELTEERRRGLLKVATDLEVLRVEGITAWQAVCLWIAQNKRLRGENPSGFRASLNWLLRPGVALEQLEAMHTQASRGEWGGEQPQVDQSDGDWPDENSPREEMVPVPGVGLCRIDADDNWIAPDPSKQEYVSNYQRMLADQFNPDGSWKSMRGGQ
jgi:hypothetical protein